MNNQEISKIKIDNTIYSLKDLEVRKKLKELLGDNIEIETSEEKEEVSNN